MFAEQEFLKHLNVEIKMVFISLLLKNNVTRGFELKLLMTD